MQPNRCLEGIEVMVCVSEWMCVGVCFDECTPLSSCGCRPECAPEHRQLLIIDSPLARQRPALCPLREEKMIGFLTDLYHRHKGETCSRKHNDSMGSIQVYKRACRGSAISNNCTKYDFKRFKSCQFSYL